MAKLKPCPFCGKSVACVCTYGEANLIDADIKEKEYGYVSTHFVAVCDCMKGGCGASVSPSYETPEEAAAAWNRRAIKEGQDG